MNKEIIFSVIIPHKNIPELLQRCLDSIPRREDIQIIVVDDNSDVDKVDFSNFPGEGDEFVEVYFTKEGKGAGYARNVGIEHAKGKWILFADADDFFTENAFGFLFSYADSTDEIIFFKTESCYSDTYERANRNIGVNSLVDNYLSERKYSENQLRYRHLPPWGKVVRTKLIQKEGIRFEEIVAANDRMFSILCGHKAQSIVCLDSLLYCVTVNKGSIAHTLSKKNLESKYTTLLRCNDFLRKEKIRYCQYSILPDLLLSRKFGFFFFLKFLRLAILYKSNPLIGFNRAISSFIFQRNEFKKNKEYIIKD